MLLGMLKGKVTFPNISSNTSGGRLSVWCDQSQLVHFLHSLLFPYTSQETDADIAIQDTLFVFFFF